MNNLNWLPIIVGGLLALGCLIAAFVCLKRKRLIDDTPTSKTQGVFIGMVELKGTAESESPLTSYLASVSCLHYHWKVDEHWTRIVHETVTDSKGHTTTRTRTESGWKTVASGGESQPFYLKDDTGVIRIVPEGADIDGVKTFEKTCGPGDPLYFGKASVGEIANTDHRRRFYETAILLHATLYVMGQARERQDVVAAEIARDKDAPLFKISIRTEKQLSAGYSIWFAAWVILGLLLSVGAVAVADWTDPLVAPGWQAYVLAAAAFMLALGLGWVWWVYNSLINLHHRVEQAWSQVDVQLKRRNDLIPNLVKAVEGYSTHEREVQQLLSDLRTQAADGEKLKGIAPELLAVVERYPQIKASESFLALQRSLSETEQRIALARGYFNESATFYNTRLLIIPDRWVAGLGRLRPQSLLEAADFERAAVKVSLVQ